MPELKKTQAHQDGLLGSDYIGFMQRRAPLIVLLLFVMATLATTNGCRKRVVPKRPAAAPRVRSLLGDESGELVEESWDAHYIRDAKIGHRHTRVYRESSRSDQLFRIEATDNLEVRRFGDIVRQEFTSVSLETPIGEIRQFEYRVVNGDAVRTAAGVVRDGAMELENSGAGESSKTRYAWPAGQGGIFAIERSLRRAPMQVGERRSVSAFLPLLDRMVRQDLHAVRQEATQIGEKQE